MSVYVVATEHWYGALWAFTTAEKAQPFADAQTEWVKLHITYAIVKVDIDAPEHIEIKLINSQFTNQPDLPGVVASNQTCELIATTTWPYPTWQNGVNDGLKPGYHHISRSLMPTAWIRYRFLLKDKERSTENKYEVPLVHSIVGTDDSKDAKEHLYIACSEDFFGGVEQKKVRVFSTLEKMQQWYTELKEETYDYNGVCSCVDTGQVDTAKFII